MFRFKNKCFIDDELREGILDLDDIVYYFNRNWGNLRYMRTLNAMLSYIAMKYQECTNEQVRGYLRKFYAYLDICVTSNIVYDPTSDSTFFNYTQRLSHLFENAKEKEPHKKPLSKLRVKNLETTAKKLSELPDLALLFIYDSDYSDPASAFAKDMFDQANSFKLSVNRNMVHEESVGRYWLSESDIHIDFAISINTLLDAVNYLCNCGSFANETMYYCDILEVNARINNALAITARIQNKYRSPYQ